MIDFATASDDALTAAARLAKEGITSYSLPSGHSFSLADPEALIRASQRLKELGDESTVRRSVRAEVVD